MLEFYFANYSICGPVKLRIYVLGYGQNWESLVDEFPKVKDILTDDVTEEVSRANQERFTMIIPNF